MLSIKLRATKHMTIRLILGLILAALLPGAASAQLLKPWPIEDVYTSRTIVTGKDERNRPLGFSLCFDDVLVKASGDISILADKRLRKLANNAARYIASFSYRDRLEGKPVHDEQGTYDRPHYLTCVFDPQKIDAVVTQLKRKPWQGNRPHLAMLITVHGFKTSGVLTRDAPFDPDMAEALNDAAIRYGMTVELPTMVTLQQHKIALDNAVKTSNDVLQDIAKTSNAELPVVGDLNFSDAARGWIATWRLDANGRRFRWSVHGVNYDEAFRNGVRGVMRALSGNGKP
jgi:hypothetical protein